MEQDGTVRLKEKNTFTSKFVSEPHDLWLLLVDPSSLGSPQAEVGLPILLTA